MKFSIMGIGLLVRALTQFGVLIISSQIFPKADVGVAAMVFAIYHLIWPWFEVAIGQAFIQLNDSDESKLQNLSLILLASGALGMLISVALYPVFVSMLDDLAVWVIVLIIAIVGLRVAALFSSYNQLKKLKVKRYALIENGSYLIGFVLALAICYHFGWGQLYLIIGLFFYSLFSGLLFYLHEFVFFRCQYEEDSAKEILSLSGGFFLGSGLNTFVREANILFIGFLLGATYAAQYSRAFQLYMLGAFTVGQVFDKLLTPIFRKNIDEPSYNRDLFEMAFIILFGVLVPVSAFIFVNAQAIIIFLFGPSWIEITPLLQLLSIGIVLRTALKINESALRAYKWVYVRVLFYLLWAGILIAFALPASKWGVIGFGMTEIIGVLAFWALSAYTAAKILDVSKRHLLAYSLAGIPATILFVLMHSFLLETQTFGGKNLILRLLAEVLIIIIITVPSVFALVLWRFKTLKILKHII